MSLRAVRPQAGDLTSLILFAEFLKMVTQLKAPVMRIKSGCAWKAPNSPGSQYVLHPWWPSQF